MEERITEPGTPPSPDPPQRSRKLGFGVLVTLAILAVNRGCSSVSASPSWIVGTGWFLGASGCIVALIWLWDHTNRRRLAVRIVLSFAAVVVMVASTYGPVVDQYRKEHPAPTPKQSDAPASPPSIAPIAKADPPGRPLTGPEILLTVQSDGDGYSGTAYGIAWNPDFQKVSMIVASEAEIDYGDLDLAIDVGPLTIVGFRQINKSPDTPSLSPVVAASPNIKLPGGLEIAKGSLASGDDKGHKTPIELSPEQPASRYRLKSPSISSHSVMEFVLAVADLDLSFKNVQAGGKLTRSIRNGFNLRISGHYFIGKQRINLTKNHQLIH